MLKIVVKKAGQDPEVREIKGTLENIQEIVGGYIECFNLGFGNILCVCNEEGKLMGLKPNFIFNGDTVVGDVFFCAGGEEDFESLTDDQIEFIITMMHIFETEKRK